MSSSGSRSCSPRDQPGPSGASGQLAERSEAGWCWPRRQRCRSGHCGRVEHRPPRTGAPTLPDPEPDAGEVRRSAEQILRDFDLDEPSRSVMEVVLDWIGRRLDSLIPDAAGGGGLDSPIGLALLALVVALIVFAIVKLVPTLQRGTSTSVPREPETPRRARRDWLVGGRAARGWRSVEGRSALSLPRPRRRPRHRRGPPRCRRQDDR